MKPDFNTQPAAGAAARTEPARRCLAELAPGAAAVILAVENGTAIGRRLADLGFLPGTRVQVISRAPLGDPTLYEIRGSRFCIRRTEARRIHVGPLPAGADG